jgi:hypothetical protein
MTIAGLIVFCIILAVAVIMLAVRLKDLKLCYEQLMEGYMDDSDTEFSCTDGMDFDDMRDKIEQWSQLTKTRCDRLDLDMVTLDRKMDELRKDIESLSVVMKNHQQYFIHDKDKIGASDKAFKEYKSDMKALTGRSYR